MQNISKFKIPNVVFIVLFLVFGFFTIQPHPARAASIAENVKGRILLQVEQNGEAWYVNPDTQLRHYMGRPKDAFELMRSQGLGITNADIAKIPPALQIYPFDLMPPSGPLAPPLSADLDGDGLTDTYEDALGTDKNKIDTDNDSFSDLIEVQNGFNPVGPGELAVDNLLVNRLKGEILLQVENNGEAWYLNPVDGKRYFLGRPADAFTVMRNLGLGITDQDLEQIDVGVDTSDWLTYRNVEFGYSVRHPMEWQAFRHAGYEKLEKIESSSDDERIVFSSVDLSSDGVFMEDGSTISVTRENGAYFIEGSKKVDDFWKKLDSTGDANKVVNRFIEKRIIGGIEFIYFDQEGWSVELQTIKRIPQALFMYNDNFFWIRPNGFVYEDFFNNFLSTFKFSEDSSNLSTYQNNIYKFEFKYPDNLSVSSSGPNEEQKKLDRGETISGTIPPSRDTVSFSNPSGEEQFNLVVFPIREAGISPAGFGGLSMGSACDTRWIDSVTDEPRLLTSGLNKDLPILEVQVASGGPIPSKPRGCYYLKNQAGNLLVFNILGSSQDSDFLSRFELVKDQILSTFKFIN